MKKRIKKKIKKLKKSVKKINKVRAQHKVAPQMQESLHIPILHIADATADALLAKRIRRTALLGTKYTMTQDFYKSRLIACGIEVVIPNESEIETINCTVSHYFVVATGLECGNAVLFFVCAMLVFLKSADTREKASLAVKGGRRT